MTDRDKWQPKDNRSSIDISADILRILRLGNTGEIQITYNAHLNHKQASSYINSLLEAGLLEGAEEEMGLPSYRITRKGLAALSVIENIKEMLPTEGNTDILYKSKIVEVNPGRIFVTKGVADLVKDNQQFALFVQNSLARYRKGDWGNMSDEGRRLNNRFLERSFRTYSSYGSERFPEIWITTEPDRSCSTIMFPDEEVSIELLERYEALKGIESPEAREASE